MLTERHPAGRVSTQQIGLVQAEVVQEGAVLPEMVAVVRVVDRTLHVSGQPQKAAFEAGSQSAPAVDVGLTKEHDLSSYLSPVGT